MGLGRGCPLCPRLQHAPGWRRLVPEQGWGRGLEGIQAGRWRLWEQVPEAVKGPKWCRREMEKQGPEAIEGVRGRHDM